MKLIAQVDKKDRKIGEVSRVDAHKFGYLHRVSYVVIFDSISGKIILQQRSKRKRFLPGKWVMLSGGHVDLGESYRAAAARELREELGIRVEPKSLIDLKVKRARDLTKLSGFSNNEMIAVFALAYDPLKHGKMKIGKGEVSGVKSVPMSKLPKRLAHFPKKFEKEIIDSLKKRVDRFK